MRSIKQIAFLCVLILGINGCAPATPVPPTPALPIQASPSAVTVEPVEIEETPTPNTLPSSTPETGCHETKGRIEIRQISDEAIPKDLGLRVYLPSCYEPQRLEPYPLLVLLHGQGFTDAQWDDLGIDETADALISEGRTVPFVIAMPREDYYLQSPADSFFPKAVCDVLLPWMAEEYDVCNKRDCRAIGGISRGAAWAVHIGFENWDLFSAIGAHSLPAFPDDQYGAPRWVAEIPDGMWPRLYVDIGDIDTYKGFATQFHDSLDYYHITHEWHIFSGGHNETYWRTHLEDYLLWYASAW